MIHETALIHPSAQIHDSVRIGPFCVVGESVSIGANCELKSHVVIGGFTRIGEGNRFFQFASIGEVCQDLKYAGEETWLEIGDNNTFRESCSVHRGTVQDESITSIGSSNLFMVNAHVAHDCRIGSNCVIANNVGLAGHCKLGDHVIIGGSTGVHQFTTIGSFAMVGGASAINKDVAAFALVGGNPAKSYGVNSEGMRRKGWSDETIKVLKKASFLLRDKALNTADVLERLKSDFLPEEPKVSLLIDSIERSSRGITR